MPTLPDDPLADDAHAHRFQPEEAVLPAVGDAGRRTEDIRGTWQETRRCKQEPMGIHMEKHTPEPGSSSRLRLLLLLSLVALGAVRALDPSSTDCAADAGARSELTRLDCTPTDEDRTHCHWSVKALLKRGGFRDACEAARAVNTTAQLQPPELDVYAWTPPGLDESVLHEDEPDAQALCDSVGLPVRRREVLIVEAMLYNFEADHLLIKLLEYGDLLEKLIVVEARTDFNGKQKPLGLAMVKDEAALRRFAHVLDHGEIECYDSSSLADSQVAETLGAHQFPWEQDNLGRAAIWHRLEQLSLQDDDIIILSDADEILSRHAVRVLSLCTVSTWHGLGRVEMETVKYDSDCCGGAPLRPASEHDWLSVTAVTWSFAQTLGQAGLGRARLLNAEIEGRGGHLAFNLVQAGWHLTNTALTPAQIRFKQGIWAAMPHIGHNFQAMAEQSYAASAAASSVPCCCQCSNATAPRGATEQLQGLALARRFPRIFRDNLEVFRRRHWSADECAAGREACRGGAQP